MNLTEAQECLIRLAGEEPPQKNHSRPEIKWLDMQYAALLKQKRFSSRRKADEYLFQQIYGKNARSETELLKIRYWRTGQHLPVNYETCLALGRALELDEDAIRYLLQGYFDSCDRRFETSSEDPVYLCRKNYMEDLIRRYFSNIPEERIRSLRSSRKNMHRYLRHLYYTDAMSYVSQSRHASQPAPPGHLVSCSYDSELTRTLQLLGNVPRKTILRHLILLGMPDISLDWLNQSLSALGYLPLEETHTLRTGERLDAILIRLMELYDSVREEMTPDEARLWMQQCCRTLDRTFIQAGKKKSALYVFQSARLTGQAARSSAKPCRTAGCLPHGSHCLGCSLPRGPQKQLAISDVLTYNQDVRQFWEEHGFGCVGGVRSHTDYPGNTLRLTDIFYDIFASSSSISSFFPITIRCSSERMI